LERQILMLIDDRPRDLGWDRIGGLDGPGGELRFHYGLALARRPAGLDIEGWNNVMLFGPPGTGKTLLAGALAHNLGATFFNVKASQVVSKWVGESGRLIAALYRVARRLGREGPPSIIFIDEFDALCQDRGRETPLHHRQMLASILTELDGFAQKGRESRVLTLGATNRPWDLDPAALSRFERRMFISLPDLAARNRILRIHLEGKGLAVRDAESLYSHLAARTARLSGREIARLCKEAATLMLTEMNSDLPGLVDRGAEGVRAYTLRVRPLGMDDFLPLLAALKPDTGQAEEDRYRKWCAEA
jgi:katanin p60 ATPase-containing subunit A1